MVNCAGARHRFEAGWCPEGHGGQDLGHPPWRVNQAGTWHRLLSGWAFRRCDSSSPLSARNIRAYGGIGRRASLRGWFSSGSGGSNPLGRTRVWRNGRRAGLRTQWPYGRAGSTPVARTRFGWRTGQGARAGLNPVRPARAGDRYLRHPPFMECEPGGGPAPAGNRLGAFGRYGSRPSRSASSLKIKVHLWRNGRRAAFRAQCPQGRGGSNPLRCTKAAIA